MSIQSEQTQAPREIEQPAEGLERAMAAQHVAEKVFQELVTQLEPEVADALRALRELQQDEAEINRLRSAQT